MIEKGFRQLMNASGIKDHTVSTVSVLLMASSTVIRVPQNSGTAALENLRLQMFTQGLGVYSTLRQLHRLFHA